MFEDAKIGDYVVVRGYREDHMSQIARITKTQIVVKTWGKFNKQSGRKVGDTTPWYYTTIRPATNEDIVRFQTTSRVLELRFKAVEFSGKAKLEQLERMSDLIDDLTK